MSELHLKVRFEKNTDLLISINELKETYLFGTPLKNNDNTEITDSSIKFYIQAATEQLENYLNLKFKKQVYEETLQFTSEDYMRWAYLRVTYPVTCPINLDGFLNQTRQVSYPKEWLVARKSSDGILYHRNLFIVPNGDKTSTTFQMLFTGLIPNLSYLGLSRIPEYWTARYVTGFDVVPKTIIDIVAKLASINVLRVISDNVLQPGIQSFSLGIDGLSQSVSSKGYDARIKGFLDDLNTRLLPQAKDYYKGYLFSVA